MRFLFVSNLYPPLVLGGYEILCRQTAERLTAQGHLVHVLTTGLPAGMPSEATGSVTVSRTLRLFTAFGQPIQGRSRLAKARVHGRNAGACRTVLREFQPDAILIWSQLRLGLGAARAAEASGIPTAYTFNDDHIAGFLPAETGLGAWVDRFLLSRLTTRGLKFQQTTAISATLKETLLTRGLPFEACRVIFQGIPLESFPCKEQPGSLHAPPRILYAGQLHEYKGVHTLLEAVGRLAGQGRSLEVTVAGAGNPDYEARLRALAAKFAVPCRFLGRIDQAELARLYRDSDVFVFPSIWDEPFGLTHLEAMASGLPLISTGHAGPGEFLTHGSNALLFPKGDVSALEERLAQMLDDSGLRQRLARAGRATATGQFSLDRYADELGAWLAQRPITTVHLPRRFVRSHWGGTETVILETLRRLQAAGNPARVVTSSALSVAGPDQIEGVPVERFRYFYPFAGLKDAGRQLLDRKGGNLFSWSLWLRLLTGPKPDLYHLHTGKRLGGIVRWTARFRKVPYVISLHGAVASVPEAEARQMQDPVQGTWEWGRLLGALVGSRRVLDDAAGILCIDPGEVALLKTRYPGKRIDHLPNGVDFARFASGTAQEIAADRLRWRRERGWPEDCRIVLNLGRIDPQKNQKLTLEVASRVLRSQPQVCFALVGNVTNEPYRQELEALIEASGFSSRIALVPGVDFLGPDLVRTYRAADAFLLTSQHEPFGIVLIEAWAAGLPVVASRVGGVPFLVRDGTDGLLFPSGDAEAAADALETLLKNPDQAHRLAQAGRLRAQEEFDWQAVTQRLTAWYREVGRDHDHSDGE